MSYVNGPVFTLFRYWWRVIPVKQGVKGLDLNHLSHEGLGQSGVWTSFDGELWIATPHANRKLKQFEYVALKDIFVENCFSISPTALACSKLDRMANISETEKTSWQLLVEIGLYILTKVCQCGTVQCKECTQQDLNCPLDGSHEESRKYSETMWNMPIISSNDKSITIPRIFCPSWHKLFESVFFFKENYYVNDGAMKLYAKIFLVVKSFSCLVKHKSKDTGYMNILVQPWIQTGNPGTYIRHSLNRQPVSGSVGNFLWKTPAVISRGKPGKSDESV